VLEWVARFRFVGAAQVASRFVVSERRARSRLARLTACGLVLSHQPHASAVKLYALSKRGFEAIGHIRRRPPRWEVQAEHDLQIAALVAGLELAAPGLEVFTDRECRRREADGDGTYSVDCQLRSGTRRRWPDVVIEGNEATVAVELEIAAKTTKHLLAILSGYLVSQTYQHLQVRCAHRSLRRRLERVVRENAYGDFVTLADRREDPQLLATLLADVEERQRAGERAREYRLAEQARQAAADHAQQLASYARPAASHDNAPERRFGRRRRNPHGEL
jgi:hypothetical protein